MEKKENGSSVDHHATTRYVDLNYSQRQKCAHFMGVYDDEVKAVTLTLMLERSGENSYKKITDKIDLLTHSDYKVQQYDDALYDYFAIGEIQSPVKVIGGVGKVRSDMGLSAYISSLKTNCERDFFKLFIVEVITEETLVTNEATGEEKTKKTIIGYKPIFKLKPED